MKLIKLHIFIAQKGADPDIGGCSPVSGEYYTEDGQLVSVSLVSYGNGTTGLESADWLTSYGFNHESGLLVNPLVTGATKSIRPECYLSV